MNSAKKMDFEPGISAESMKKEMDIRAWIARKESVCPYAPVHLPEINSMTMEHVYYLANELKAFYEDKVDGTRVGRWMLIPHAEWQSHDEAHIYAERIFWLLNAAYYHLMRDKKSVQMALKRQLPGFERAHKSDIINSIVGKQPNPNANSIPAKSLFFSALSPLYKSKKFYRYCPHSVMPMVYVSEFQDLKLRHPKVTEKVTFDMAVSGLREILGDTIELDREEFRAELPHWGAIIDRTAAIIRSQEKGVSSLSPEAQGCPGTNLSYFRVCPPQLIEAFFLKHREKLPILSRFVDMSEFHPQDLIKSAFAGSGLYVIPDYPVANDYQAVYH